MTSTAPKTQDLLERRDRNIARGIATAHPILASKAKGTELWDVEGRRYLDFVGGIGVLNVGHNHPRVVDAVKRQIETLSHACFQVLGYEPYVALAEKLNTLIGKDYKSAFFTSGAEAVENSVKIARGYTNRPAVIAFRGGFHGRTLLGVSLTGMSQPYKQNFGPFAPEIFHIPYPNAYRGVTTADALAALAEVFATDVAPERVAAIIIEPVQGDGGFHPAPVNFVAALREITNKHGIVLILDEIQTGFGRTGEMFGFQHSGIEPDLVTIAKSLAGGLPLSAVVGKAEIMDAPTPGGLGGTYGGNALACAAALAVIETFERDDILRNGRQRAAQLRKGLIALQQRHAFIGDVRGLGFMLAIEIVSDRATKAPDADRTQHVLDEARKGGLLLIKCGIHRNTVRFLAPLVATEAEIDEALAALGEALERVD
ncbi:4-aminobutyrate--2-oxoglutarate transaminase [Phyllobacterium endophyticum]|uniref:4-aminobutyrate--2-oxoglutarate transaminase n=1 Tax=Phyllobacterium endophyticum TaxID=1149773 RepID=A0A2P7ASD0_9HYPH|nr:4-aminobutyrate--2-oxoglutarate transaminase [Phyllobacterium endophyticum]MBB3236809.1 4-aminobutyrate aminotransferase/(S)-3-amino-2-methylpropionate transaminase [Phyllobacterium endophyticum]PSH57080.1 4-aminobutyrate--2-oxoglutarate transaminase [Phyllobacterium endophyticum]TYR40360.1 4-aminobutyrate--2-oxoglutarate transaminase [Phyllobacterium endophyticum]